MPYGRPTDGLINGMTPQQLVQKWQSLGSDAARAGFIGGPFGAKNLQVLQHMGLIDANQINALDANYRGTVGYDPQTGNTWQAGEDGQSRNFTSGQGAVPGRNTYGNNAMTGQGGPVGPLFGPPSQSGGPPAPGSGPTPPGPGAGGPPPGPSAGGGLGPGTIGGIGNPNAGGGAGGTMGPMGAGMPPGGMRYSNLRPPTPTAPASGGSGTLQNSGLPMPGGQGGGWGGGGPINAETLQRILPTLFGPGGLPKPAQMQPPVAMTNSMPSINPGLTPSPGIPGAPQQVPVAKIAQALAAQGA